MVDEVERVVPTRHQVGQQQQEGPHPKQLARVCRYFIGGINILSRRTGTYPCQCFHMTFSLKMGFP